MPDASVDRALIEFYRRAERRIKRNLQQMALSGWRTAYCEARLQEIGTIIAALDAKTRLWSTKQLPLEYKDARKNVAYAMGKALVPFNPIDEGMISVLVTATNSDVGMALRSVVPQLERVYIDARQAMITAEQVKDQVARGIIEGLTPRQTSRALERALRTGATRQLSGVLDLDARARLVETAQGRYISIMCKDGVTRRYQLRPYAEMVQKSTRSMTAAEGTLQTATALDVDLIRISVHVGACPMCIPYQGMVYSLMGETPGFPIMGPDDRTPYHPWCGHSMNPVTVEMLEANGELEEMRAFVNDPQRVVTNGLEYAEVRAGRSEGTPLEEALDAQAEAEKLRRAA